MCVNNNMCCGKRLKPITGVVATTGFIVSLFTTLILGCGSAVADLVEFALVQAYQNNEQLNAQRALVRATDEQVPQALAGYRPRASATLTGGEQSISRPLNCFRRPPEHPRNISRIADITLRILLASPSLKLFIMAFRRQTAHVLRRLKFLRHVKLCGLPSNQSYLMR